MTTLTMTRYNTHLLFLVSFSSALLFKSYTAPFRIEFQISRTGLISVHNLYMNVYVIVRFQYQCSEIYDIRSANKDEVRQGIIICGSRFSLFTRSQISIFSADSRISVTQSPNISRWSLLIAVRFKISKNIYLMDWRCF